MVCYFVLWWDPNEMHECECEIFGEKVGGCKLVLNPVTWALPRSSQSLRIVAIEDIMLGLLSRRSTVSLLIPSPKRKNMCTSTTCNPVLTCAFFRYSSAFGKFPEANHFASNRKALHNLAHCNTQEFQRCRMSNLHKTSLFINI